MIIEKLSLGVLQTNSYLIGDEESKEAIIIDVPDSAEHIHALLEKHELTLKAILLTHGHCDHILGANRLRELTGAMIYIHAADEIMINNADINLSNQFPGGPASFKSDVQLTGDEVLQFGKINIQVYSTPGHTLGSVVYVIKDKCYSGDTLFHEGVGRTDFYGGSSKSLIKSIQEVIFKLPDDTRVYPGHGDKTTIKHEKRNNPVLR